MYFRQPIFNVMEHKKQDLIIYGIILGFTIALYANTLTHDYALDDAIVITQNTFTKKGFSGIKEILTSESFTGFFGVKKNLVAGGRYRPLSVVTYAIEIQFFGMKPFISHLVNLLLYALTGMIIYRILNLLLRQKKDEPWYSAIPFITALLFIAHPLHTEVIANIKGRDEILAMLGALFSLYFTILWSDTKNQMNLIYSAICFFIGMMSKENAVTFLAVIPISLYYFKNGSVRTITTATIPPFIAFLLFMVIRRAVLGDTGSNMPDELMNNPFLYASEGEKYATIFYTLGVYIKLLFLPTNLTFDYYPYHIPIIGWMDLRAIVPLTLYIAIGYLALSGFKKKTVLSFSVIYYLATLSIVSNLFFPIGAFMNERFAYMPSLGWCLAIAYLAVKTIPSLMQSNPLKQYFTTGFTLVILIAFSIRTIARNPVWKNDFTLFTNDVKISHNSAKSNCSAGGKLLEEAQVTTDSTLRKQYIEQSKKYLLKSIRIHPTYRDALLLAGNLYYDTRQYDSTMYYYKYILRLSPQYDLVYSNTERIFNTIPDVQFKLNELLEISKINPNRYEVNYMLGNLYGKYMNNIPAAISYLERAVAINPRDPKGLKDLGVAYGISGRFADALAQFEKALQLAPEDVDLNANIGITYQRTGDMAKSSFYLQKAQELKAKEQAAMNK